MNRFRNLIAVFAFALLVLALPSMASAQRRGDRNNDYYGSGVNNRNIKSTVKNLKNRSKQFARQVDHDLDHSRYDGTNREDRIDDLVKNFADAADHLEDKYDNGRNMNRSADEARRVLDLGARINRVIYRARLNRNLQGDWNNIQQDLRVIASAYNLNNARDRRGY